MAATVTTVGKRNLANRRVCLLIWGETDEAESIGGTEVEAAVVTELSLSSSVNFPDNDWRFSWRAVIFVLISIISRLIRAWSVKSCWVFLTCCMAGLDMTWYRNCCSFSIFSFILFSRFFIWSYKLRRWLLVSIRFELKYSFFWSRIVNCWVSEQKDLEPDWKDFSSQSGWKDRSSS